MLRPKDYRCKLRNYLLPRTISHAANSVSAYDYLLAYTDMASNAADLVNLPILYKCDLLARGVEYTDRNLRTSLLQHTSGSTGKKMMLHRCPEEVAFQSKFNRSVLQRNSPLCIFLSAATAHGEPTPIPYNGRVISIEIFDDAWQQNLANLITAPWEFVGEAKQPVILAGLEPYVRIVTALLLENRYDFRSSAVSMLSVSGDFVTSARANWYEGIWNAPLVDIYSMTEISAAAPVCQECGERHIDPTVIAEVVDPFSLEPIGSGLGALIVTTLNPFVIKQPLIRYWTGDLVERIENTCDVDELSFRLCGRLDSAVLKRKFDTTLAWIVPGWLLECIDRIPEIERSKRFMSVRGISDYSLFGYPIVNVDHQLTDPPTIKVTFRLRFSSYSYPERAAQIERNLYEDILSMHPDLCRSQHLGEVKLVVKAVDDMNIRALEVATVT